MLSDEPTTGWMNSGRSQQLTLMWEGAVDEDIAIARQWCADYLVPFAQLETTTLSAGVMFSSRKFWEISIRSNDAIIVYATHRLLTNLRLSHACVGQSWTWKRLKRTKTGFLTIADLTLWLGAWEAACNFRSSDGVTLCFKNIAFSETDAQKLV